MAKGARKYNKQLLLYFPIALSGALAKVRALFFAEECYNKYASVQQASSDNRITQMTLFFIAWAVCGAFIWVAGVL